MGDFPDDPVAEPPCAQCKGPGSTPGQGTRPHMPQRRPGIAKSIIFLFKAEEASPGLSNILKTEEEKALKLPSSNPE